MSSESVAPSTSYEHATSHYLSADRRDPVKCLWEEPFSRTVLARSIRALEPDPSRSVRVLDVGAGVGDGFSLLETAVGETDGEVPDLRGLPFSYLGLDVDADMVETARAQFRDRPEVGFLQADVRRELPEDPFDLYMSAGVPYSHLTADEFTAVLTDLFATIHRHGSRAVVVLDVLGRYSMEWAPRWSQSSWDYNMSFFADTESAEAITARMTFYSRASLWECIAEAAGRAGAAVADIEFYDRSVVVGRHTVTGAFNPGLAPYRLLLNRLFDGDVAVDLADLALTPPTQDAPAEIAGFFASFCSAWNDVVADAAVREQRHGVTACSRRGLARALRGVEHGMQRGLGTGHSLIAVVGIDGSR